MFFYASNTIYQYCIYFILQPYFIFVQKDKQRLTDICFANYYLVFLFQYIRFFINYV